MASAGEIAGLRLLGHSDLGGPGDGMQIMYSNDHIYVGRPSPKNPVLIVNVSDPVNAAVVGEIPSYPATSIPKCQVHDDLLLVNYEQKQELHPQGRTGWGVFDISTPDAPREISYFNTGGRPNVVGGRTSLLYVGTTGGLRWADAANLRHEFAGEPRAGRAMVESGLWKAGGEEEQKRGSGAGTGRMQIHHGIHHDGRQYCGHGPPAS